MQIKNTNIARQILLKIHNLIIILMVIHLFLNYLNNQYHLLNFLVNQITKILIGFIMQVVVLEEHNYKQNKI
jgi:hypothetical protein